MRAVQRFERDGSVALVEWNEVWEEYVVTFSWDANAAYHTDDKEDAINTARFALAANNTHTPD